MVKVEKQLRTEGGSRETGQKTGEMDGQEQDKQEDSQQEGRRAGAVTARGQRAAAERKDPLTKLRVAVRRPRSGATTVPLRLRPIRLGLAPSPGSAPKRQSCNAIGC